MTNPLLIVLDDDPKMANLVEYTAEVIGFDVCVTTDAEAFQKAFLANSPSVIVLDIFMPDMDGIELLMWLAEQKCSAPIILMSGYDNKFLDMAGRLGDNIGDTIFGSLTKPFKVSDLENLLKDALTSSD